MNTKQPAVLLEVIDPDTGRKLNVHVSYHASWVGGSGYDFEDVARDVDRCASAVVDGLGWSLSDWEDATA